MEELTLPSFAKINLILRVIGKRKDGYHALETVFQTVDLHDRLTFRLIRKRGFHVNLEVEENRVAADESNLIYRACQAFHEARPIGGQIDVHLQKNIPVQSGLAGGSSNAAATLIALSRMLNQPLSKKQLTAIARKLGADVPFFLTGGTALGQGRGDRITALDDWPSSPVLIVHPEVSCSTASIYRQFDEARLLTQSRNSIKIHLDQRPASLRDFVSQIENDLEKVVFALYPELESIKKRLYSDGAVAAAMTGSGSAIFGLFMDPGALEKAAQHFPASYKTHFLTRNEYEARTGLTQF